MHKQVTQEDVRSFTIEQFERIKKSNDIKDLIHFHTINKYLFMAQSQSQLRILGNLVANKDKKPASIIFQEYENNLSKIMNCESTIKSTTNVLDKIYGHFKKKFTPEEKKQFLKQIENFRNCDISLGEVLHDLDKYVEKYENGYLQRQTFYLLYSDRGYNLF